MPLPLLPFRLDDSSLLATKCDTVTQVHLRGDEGHVRHPLRHRRECSSPAHRRWVDCPSSSLTTSPWPQILEQVFRVPSLSTSESPSELASRPLYNKQNKFWSALSVNDLVASLPEGEEKEKMVERVREVKKMYDGLSETYQSGKGDKGIPLA